MSHRELKWVELMGPVASGDLSHRMRRMCSD